MKTRLSRLSIKRVQLVNAPGLMIVTISGILATSPPSGWTAASRRPPDARTHAYVHDLDLAKM